MKFKILTCAVIAFFVCSSCSSGKQSSVDYVDPFIGTGFHGHTYPGATVPFGGVQLSETGMLVRAIITVILF